MRYVAVALALTMAAAAAPATAITPAEAPLHAAKKKKKKKPRYRISINHERKSQDHKNCRSTTEENLWYINETQTSLRKWSETGVYPGGGSRRTGYEEITLKTESTDPYVPSDEQTLPRRSLDAFYNKDQWEFQVNVKRTKLSYDWENADGDVEDVVIRTPRKVGRSTKKTLTDSYRSPDTTDEDGRCTSWSESTVTETVTVTRVE